MCIWGLVHSWHSGPGTEKHPMPPCPSLACGHAGGTVSYLVEDTLMMTSYISQVRQICTCYLASQTPTSETLAPQDASVEAGTASWHFPDPWVGAVGSSAQPREWGQRSQLLLFFPVLLSRGRGSSVKQEGRAPSPTIPLKSHVLLGKSWPVSELEFPYVKIGDDPPCLG